MSKTPFKNCFLDIPLTWLAILLMGVLPVIAYGSVAPAHLLLFLVVMVILPIVIYGYAKKDPELEKWVRRLVVIVAGSMIVIGWGVIDDAQVIQRLKPVVEASQAYFRDHNAYPNTMDDLVPKYLSEAPTIRHALNQPELKFGESQGKHSLTVPSARGDAYSKHEYVFEDDAWFLHY